MNKIILLSDKGRLPKGAMKLACTLNEQSPILLCGVFLPEVDYWNMLYFYSYGMGAPDPIPYSSYGPADEKAVDEFRRSCELAGIEFRIYDKHYEYIKEELKLESRFADMMMMSNEAFQNDLASPVAQEYTQEVLRLAECPVLVVPEQFERIEEIILAYDGSAVSVYAIRQFAQLLPDLAKRQTLLIYLDADVKNDFPERALIEELAARHFPDLTFMKLDASSKKHFREWVSHEWHPLLVTGAKGRSGISELFRRSFASDVIRKHMLPVFIAH